MTKRFFIVCALLVLAGCALNPTGATSGAFASNGDRPISPPARCDRIKVVCVDLTGPGATQMLLPLPTVTLPALPSVLTLPR